MSIIQVKGGGRGIAADRTLFVGPTTPPEIKAMIKPLKQVDKPTLRKILQVVVLGMEGKEVDPATLEDVHNNKITEEVISIIFAGLYKLIQLALRVPKSSLKQEVFKEDLLELKIPEEFVPDIGSVVFGSKRSSIEANSRSNVPTLPKLDNFRWRVDVAISTSVLQRVLEPTVLMEMTLSDGTRHEMEVPISKFHELRFSVASVLKEMEDLEKRNILKIMDTN